ncbi:uncharacterized protein J4E88_005268 [Alternaria novae-zelandiae]|uniref:uncharacterized protein n=1 Tax=Alternaria novae-zelandiae TaxID=430562 RepID=UPI0020C1CE38|nr:uncharacterized protein J4E88_005268 [Alternaria novae-zelandiae]KAI4682378.1 hypothetical protein J4E88_005268 [Alternaria novae-zelandiae]
MFFHVNGLNWDDFLVLATVVLAVPSVVIVDRCMLPNGIGIDIWNVPFDHIDNFIRWLYVVTLLYLLQAALVKITLLSFFLRIFLRRRTVQLLWGTIIFIGLWTFSIFIPAAMPCLPVRQDHSRGARVTVVSILRLKSLFFFDGDNNYTWKQAKVVLWSMYELHVGVICACIPTLRLIFIRAIPSVISSIQGSTQRSSANGNGSRRSRGTTQNVDTLRSDRGGKEGLAVEPNTITYTRTFAVRHEENDEEVELVHMEDLSEKTSRERGGSYASELSL